MEYYLKNIAPDELPGLYPRLERDFPPAERKELPHMQRLMEQEMSVGWRLMADGGDAGYAFLLRHPAVPFVLLDYLAMETHGAGAGSICLALLQNEYPQGILAECEDTGPGLSPAENRLRRRRMDFYRRAGFVPTPFENHIFTVRYLVHLWCPEKPPKPCQAAAQALDALYALQLPDAIYRTRVFIDPPAQS